MTKENPNLIPDRPKIITSDIEAFSYYHKMNPSKVISNLIEGEYVIIEDYYSDGLKVLKALKKILKREYTGSSFHDQRAYRFAFRDASHRLLLMVEDNELIVKKSPDIGWLKILYPNETDFLISFPELQGLNSSWQWYINGLEIELLNLTIYPYYGIYFPTRFDHLLLFDNWVKSYEGEKGRAIDIGVGSGILSFLLLQNGFSHVLGTDTNKNAIIGTKIESERLGFANQLTVEFGDLFANCDFKAELIVFNPPWLKAEHSLNEGIDKAIYYPPDLFPRFFAQAKHHLAEDGKLVLLFSNFAKVVNKEDIHPIINELENQDRFKKETMLTQNVKSSSKRTKRKDFRKYEKVELWVLTHK